VVSQLFSGRLAPITDDCGFIEASPAVAAKAWAATLSESLAEYRGEATIERLSGDLRELLHRLPPLSVPDSRYLFVGTTSHWTAFWTNGFRGADIEGPMSRLASRLGCRTVRVTCVSGAKFRYADGRPGRRYGAVIWTVFGPEGSPPLNGTRGVEAANDGGRWHFGTYGEPLPFEDATRYEAPRTVDRFTPDLLAANLIAMGIDAFNPEFYGRSGQLVHSYAELAVQPLQVTLEHARLEAGLIAAAPDVN
jgi:hypothetical protein